MYYMTIDTCVLIELGKKLENLEVINSIRMLMDQFKLSLIIPEIVKSEWDIHKENKIMTHQVESIKGKFKNYKDITNLLEDDINNIESDYIESIIREKARLIIKAIDDLINHKNTMLVTINNEVKLQAVEWSLLKKAPMHKKSSMADTLIILSSIYYAKNHNLNCLLFVSSNHRDYADDKDKSTIHSDLLDLVSNLNFAYFNNIGQAINYIEKGLISDEIVQRIEYDNTSIRCYKCGAKMNDGSWRRSQYGSLTWQHSCFSCGAIYDTGEFWD